MNNQYLIQLSSNGLNSANNIQQQISQKKFEIKLVDINSANMSMQDAGMYHYNQQRKQLLEMEISNLTSQRNNHINDALMYALMIAEEELLLPPSSSIAAMLLANIRSFLTIQNVSFTVSLPIMMKILLLQSKLQQMNLEYPALRGELLNIKLQLQI